MATSLQPLDYSGMQVIGVGKDPLSSDLEYQEGPSASDWAGKNRFPNLDVWPHQPTLSQ